MKPKYINIYIYTTLFIIFLFVVYHIFKKKNNSMLKQMNIQQSTSTTQAIAAIDSSGNLSALSFPSGFILIWYPTDPTLKTLAQIIRIVPTGWVICDGTKGTPDLRGRFVLMAQDTIPTINVPPGCTIHEIGQIGGREKHALTIDEMPSHTHTTTIPANGGRHPDGGQSQWQLYGQQNQVSSPSGGNKPHEIMPPFHTLVYLMKL